MTIFSASNEAETSFEVYTESADGDQTMVALASTELDAWEQARAVLEAADANLIAAIDENISRCEEVEYERRLRARSRRNWWLDRDY